MVRETRHLWVGNLPENIREDEIREHFKRYGRVQNVKIVLSSRCQNDNLYKNGSANCGISVAVADGFRSPEKNGGICATISFMDIKSASKAHNSDQQLEDHTLTTEYYEPDTPPPTPPPSLTNSVTASSLAVTVNAAALTTNHLSPLRLSSNSQHQPLTPYLSPRFTPHGHSEDISNLDRSSHFFERRDGRRSSSTPFHVVSPSESLRSRTRDRGEKVYRTDTPHYTPILESIVPRTPPNHHRSVTPGWNSSCSRYHSSVVAGSPELYQEESRETSPVLIVHKKTSKSRRRCRLLSRHNFNASESGSNNNSDSSRSRSHSSSSSSHSRSSSASSTSSSEAVSEQSYSVQSRCGSIKSTATVHSTLCTPLSHFSPLTATEERRPYAICVRNLPTDCSDSNLKDNLFNEFKKHGKVTFVKLVDEDNKKYAIIYFKKSEDVDNALLASKDKLFFNSKIEVSPYNYDAEDDDSCEYWLVGPDVDEYHPKASRTLYIGNLNKDTTTTDLHDIFKKFGDIITINIKENSIYNSAFCEYCDITSVTRAIHEMSDCNIFGRKLCLGFGISPSANALFLGGLKLEKMDNDKYVSTFSQFGHVAGLVSDKSRRQCILHFQASVVAYVVLKQLRGLTVKEYKLQADFASRECQQRFHDTIKKVTGTRYKRSKEHQNEEPIITSEDICSELLDCYQKILVPIDVSTIYHAHVSPASCDSLSSSFGSHCNSSHCNAMRKLLFGNDVPCSSFHYPDIEYKCDLKHINMYEIAELFDIPPSMMKERIRLLHELDEVTKMSHIDSDSDESDREKNTCREESRPGTPLCDERPENLLQHNEKQQKRKTSSVTEPLSLPLPLFASDVSFISSVQKPCASLQKPSSRPSSHKSLSPACSLVNYSNGYKCVSPTHSSTPPYKSYSSPGHSSSSRNECRNSESTLQHLSNHKYFQYSLTKCSANLNAPLVLHSTPYKAEPYHCYNSRAENYNKRNDLNNTGNSDDSLLSPPASPRWEDKIKCIDERIRAGVKTKYKLLNADEIGTQQSDILKTVLAKKSIFDEDSRRLQISHRTDSSSCSTNNTSRPALPNHSSSFSKPSSQKNEPSALKVLQYPFPSHSPSAKPLASPNTVKHEPLLPSVSTCNRISTNANSNLSQSSNKFKFNNLDKLYSSQILNNNLLENGVDKSDTSSSSSSRCNSIDSSHRRNLINDVKGTEHGIKTESYDYCSDPRLNCNKLRKESNYHYDYKRSVPVMGYKSEEYHHKVNNITSPKSNKTCGLPNFKLEPVQNSKESVLLNEKISLTSSIVKQEQLDSTNENSKISDKQSVNINDNNEKSSAVVNKLDLYLDNESRPQDIKHLETDQADSVEVKKTDDLSHKVTDSNKRSRNSSISSIKSSSEKHPSRRVSIDSNIDDSAEVSKSELNIFSFDSAYRISENRDSENDRKSVNKLYDKEKVKNLTASDNKIVENQKYKDIEPKKSDELVRSNSNSSSDRNHKETTKNDSIKHNNDKERKENENIKVSSKESVKSDLLKHKDTAVSSSKKHGEVKRSESYDRKKTWDFELKDTKQENSVKQKDLKKSHADDKWKDNHHDEYKKKDEYKNKDEKKKDHSNEKHKLFNKKSGAEDTMLAIAESDDILKKEEFNKEHSLKEGKRKNSTENGKIKHYNQKKISDVEFKRKNYSDDDEIKYKSVRSNNCATFDSETSKLKSDKTIITLNICRLNNCDKEILDNCDKENCNRNGSVSSNSLSESSVYTRRLISLDSIESNFDEFVGSDNKRDVQNTFLNDLNNTRKKMNNRFKQREKSSKLSSKDDVPYNSENDMKSSKSNKDKFRSEQEKHAIRKENIFNTGSESETGSYDDEEMKIRRRQYSIFDIVDNEPAYISMYDKVKARSTKNLQKQEEEKRQEKLKDKFSQLKQSRAKREEKKRSTSYDDDDDTDSERALDRRSNKLLDSSDDDVTKKCDESVVKLNKIVINSKPVTSESSEDEQIIKNRFNKIKNFILNSDESDMDLNNKPLKKVFKTDSSESDSSPPLLHPHMSIMDEDESHKLKPCKRKQKHKNKEHSSDENKKDPQKAPEDDVKIHQIKHKKKKRKNRSEIKNVENFENIFGSMSDDSDKISSHCQISDTYDADSDSSNKDFVNKLKQRLDKENQELNEAGRALEEQLLKQCDDKNILDEQGKLKKKKRKKSKEEKPSKLHNRHHHHHHHHHHRHHKRHHHHRNGERKSADIEVITISSPLPLLPPDDNDTLCSQLVSSMPSLDDNFIAESPPTLVCLADSPPPLTPPPLASSPLISPPLTPPPLTPPDISEFQLLSSDSMPVLRTLASNDDTSIQLSQCVLPIKFSNLQYPLKNTTISDFGSNQDADAHNTPLETLQSMSSTKLDSLPSSVKQPVIGIDMDSNIRDTSLPLLQSTSSTKCDNSQCLVKKPAIPGFGIDVDANVHDTAVKSISESSPIHMAQTATAVAESAVSEPVVSVEEKPTPISQEETEDAVAAILGESSVNSFSYPSCYVDVNDKTTVSDSETLDLETIVPSNNTNPNIIEDKLNANTSSNCLEFSGKCKNDVMNTDISPIVHNVSTADTSKVISKEPDHVFVEKESNVIKSNEGKSFASNLPKSENSLINKSNYGNKETLQNSVALPFDHRDYSKRILSKSCKSVNPVIDNDSSVKNSQIINIDLTNDSYEIHDSAKNKQPLKLNNNLSDSTKHTSFGKSDKNENIQDTIVLTEDTSDLVINLDESSNLSDVRIDDSLKTCNVDTPFISADNNLKTVTGFKGLLHETDNKSSAFSSLLENSTSDQKIKSNERNKKAIEIFEYLNTSPKYRTELRKLINFVPQFNASLIITKNEQINLLGDVRVKKCYLERVLQLLKDENAVNKKCVRSVITDLLIKTFDLRNMIKTPKLRNLDTGKYKVDLNIIDISNDDLDEIQTICDSSDEDKVETASSRKENIDPGISANVADSRDMRNNENDDDVEYICTTTLVPAASKPGKQYQINKNFLDSNSHQSLESVINSDNSVDSNFSQNVTKNDSVNVNSCQTIGNLKMNENFTDDNFCQNTENATYSGQNIKNVDNSDNLIAANSYKNIETVIKNDSPKKNDENFDEISKNLGISENFIAANFCQNSENVIKNDILISSNSCQNAENLINDENFNVDNSYQCDKNMTTFVKANSYQNDENLENRNFIDNSYINKTVNNDSDISDNSCGSGKHLKTIDCLNGGKNAENIPNEGQISGECSLPAINECTTPASNQDHTYVSRKNNTYPTRMHFNSLYKSRSLDDIRDLVLQKSKIRYRPRSLPSRLGDDKVSVEELKRFIKSYNVNKRGAFYSAVNHLVDGANCTDNKQKPSSTSGNKKKVKPAPTFFSSAQDISKSDVADKNKTPLQGKQYDESGGNELYVKNNKINITNSVHPSNISDCKNGLMSIENDSQYPRIFGEINHNSDELSVSKNMPTFHSLAVSSIENKSINSLDEAKVINLSNTNDMIEQNTGKLTKQNKLVAEADETDDITRTPKSNKTITGVGNSLEKIVQGIRQRYKASHKQKALENISTDSDDVDKDTSISTHSITSTEGPIIESEKLLELFSNESGLYDDLNDLSDNSKLNESDEKTDSSLVSDKQTDHGSFSSSDMPLPDSIEETIADKEKLLLNDSDEKVSSVMKRGNRKRKIAASSGVVTRGRNNKSLPSDVYDFNEESEEEAKRPRFVFSTKGKIAVIESLSPPLPSSSPTLPVSSKINNTRKSRRLQEKDGSRTSIDETIEEVIKASSTLSPKVRRTTRTAAAAATVLITNAQESTRKGSRSKRLQSKQQPLPKMIINNLNNEVHSFIPPNPVVADSADSNTPAVPEDENNIFPNSPSLPPSLSSPSSPPISASSPVSTRISTEPRTLIDPVTGLLIPMKESEEGLYIPLLTDISQTSSLDETPPEKKRRIDTIHSQNRLSSNTNNDSTSVHDTNAEKSPVQAALSNQLGPVSSAYINRVSNPMVVSGIPKPHSIVPELCHSSVTLAQSLPNSCTVSAIATCDATKCITPSISSASKVNQIVNPAVLIKGVLSTNSAQPISPKTHILQSLNKGKISAPMSPKAHILQSINANRENTVGVPNLSPSSYCNQAVIGAIVNSPVQSPQSAHIIIQQPVPTTNRITVHGVKPVPLEPLVIQSPPLQPRNHVQSMTPISAHEPCEESPEKTNCGIQSDISGGDAQHGIQQTRYVPPSVFQQYMIDSTSSPYHCYPAVPGVIRNIPDRDIDDGGRHSVGSAGSNITSSSTPPIDLLKQPLYERILEQNPLGSLYFADDSVYYKGTFPRLPRPQEINSNILSGEDAKPHHLQQYYRQHQNESPSITNAYISQVPTDDLIMRYPIMWQGVLALKNDRTVVQMNYIIGDPDIARCSLPMNKMCPPLLRIVQRMRLEQAQLEGVARKMQSESEHCMLLASPCGKSFPEVGEQSGLLDNGFLKYLQQKQAAGIVNVAPPGSSQAAYVVHIFPPCDFANENAFRFAPDLMQRASNMPYLIIIIATV